MFNRVKRRKRAIILQFINQKGNLYRFDVYCYDTKLNNSAIIGYVIYNKSNGIASISSLPSDFFPFDGNVNQEILNIVKENVKTFEKASTNSHHSP